jgi:hypothetical protein
LSKKQFALIKGHVINIMVNLLLVFNPEGRALLSGAQTPQQFLGLTPLSDDVNDVVNDGIV